MEARTAPPATRTRAPLAHLPARSGPADVPPAGASPLSGCAQAPLTSETPLPGAAYAPLTSETPLVQEAPLTSEAVS
ncbi:hypothetical protein GCM10010302_21720 [Streptomyces polychromogenes]|uniref:Uncharacterized protein n=1 Tax=Streptomyces polychromogenes TaxID=67342 RepID=A0ABP3EZJ4_9ACTN